MQNDKLKQGTLFDNPPRDESFKLLPLDQYDVIAVCYSGRSGIAADSHIWARVNGKVHRTTPAALTSLCEMTIAHCEIGTQVFCPVDHVELLTASSKLQGEATAVWGRVRHIATCETTAATGLYEIKTFGGRSVRVSGGHKVMRVHSGRHGPAVAPRFAASLKARNILLGVTDLGFECPEADLPDWMLRLTGLWLADGCFVTNKGKSLGKMIISTGGSQSMIDFLSRLPRTRSKAELAAELFPVLRGQHATHAATITHVAEQLQTTRYSVLNGIYRGAKRTQPFIRPCVKLNGDVWLHDRGLVDQLRGMGLNGGSHTKVVPDWAFSLSKRQVGLILAGYFDGDGCMGERGPSCSSVNRTLIYGMRDLLLRLGIESGISSRSRIGGFTTRSTRLYSLCIAKVEAVRRFEKQVPTFKQVDMSVCERHGWRAYPFRMRGIKAIHRLPDRPGGVYNFAIDGSDTLVADSLLVHANSEVTDAFLVAEDRGGRDSDAPEAFHA